MSERAIFGLRYEKVQMKVAHVLMEPESAQSWTLIIHRRYLFTYIKTTSVITTAIVSFQPIIFEFAFEIDGEREQEETCCFVFVIVSAVVNVDVGMELDINSKWKMRSFRFGWMQAISASTWGDSLVWIFKSDRYTLTRLFSGTVDWINFSSFNLWIRSYQVQFLYLYV